MREPQWATSSDRPDPDLLRGATFVVLFCGGLGWFVCFTTAWTGSVPLLVASVVVAGPVGGFLVSTYLASRRPRGFWVWGVLYALPWLGWGIMAAPGIFLESGDPLLALVWLGAGVVTCFGGVCGGAFGQWKQRKVVADIHWR